jgi:predicted ArsR family transcriptional regulator
MNLPVRSTDPESSFEAAERCVAFAGNHRERILHCLRHFGPLSKDQISDLTGLTPVQIDRRLPELERAGKAETTGEYRQSRAGCRERVWKSTTEQLQLGIAA